MSSVRLQSKAADAKRTKRLVLMTVLLAGFSSSHIGPVAASEPVEGANFKIAGKTSRALQRYTGLTWLADRVLGLGGWSAVKAALGGKARIKIRSYSFTDALSGKFRQVEVKLKGCHYKDIPLPELKMTTSTPLHVNAKSGVLTPVMVQVSGEATEQEISRALKSPKVSSQLNFLRLDLPGLGDQHLQILEPTIEIVDSKVRINARLITAGAAPETGIKVDITARPVLKDERFIMLEDTKIQSPDIVEPEKFSKFAEDLLNPLIDFGRLDRTNRAFRLTELVTDKHKVRFAGKLLLAPKAVSPPSVKSPPNTDKSGKK